MKRVIFILCLLASTCMPSISLAMMPQLSSGEMQQLEQLEKQLMQEIDQYVSSLSPEEQRQFHEAVEAETKKIEQMQPDELNKYIEDTFSGIEESVKQPISPAVPTKPTEPTKTEEAKEIKPEQTEKQAKAIDLIDNLIKQIESYQLKINAIPDLAAKLPKWAKQGRIIGWKEDMTFNSFKKEVESLNQQLQKLKKRDEKNKKYIFLPDLIENEALLNNLAKINNTLKHWVPQIKLRTLEIESISVESKKASIQAINALLEGLTILALPKAIDDIIVKYDPIAKQKREEEEKSRKKAVEDSKRGSRPVARSIGSDPGSRGGARAQGLPTTSGYPSRSRNYGGYGGGYSPQMSYGPGPSYGPTRTPSRQQPSMGRPTSGTRSRSPFDGSPGISDKPKSESDKGQDKKASTKKIELTEQAKRRINNIVDSVERALDRLEKAKLLKPLDVISRSGDLDLSETQIEIEYAYRAIDYLNDAISSINRLSITGTAQQKQLYANKLNGMLKDLEKPIKALAQQIKKVQDLQDDISIERQYIYLGGRNAGEVSDELKAIKPFNIYTVGNLLKELDTAIKALGIGQEVKPKKQSI